MVFRNDTNKERKFEIEVEANKICFTSEGDADLFVDIEGKTKYLKLTGRKLVEIFDEDSDLSPKK